MAIPQSADVVIIGGGVVGTSTAYHLTRLGCRNVLVLERDALAAGSTGRSLGGIRCVFSSETNVRIMLESIPVFERFRDQFGLDISFRQYGYLFLINDQRVLDTFRANAVMQRRLGFDMQELTPEQARERLIPQMNTEGLIAAIYSPQSGYADPTSATHGFANRAREQGATIRVGVDVTGILLDGERIRGVRTSDGEVRTDTVVCAAGAWSGQVAAMVGRDLPVYGWRQQAFNTGPFADMPERLPLTINFLPNFSGSTYMRREGRGLLLGMTNEQQAPGFDTHFDESQLETLIPASVQRYPVLERATIAGGWAGLYDRSPDENAVIGRFDSPDRFFYATGFSGHGFMMSPAVGRAVAQLVLEGRSDLDLSEFSAERFSNGRLFKEAMVI